MTPRNNTLLFLSGWAGTLIIPQIVSTPEKNIKNTLSHEGSSSSFAFYSQVITCQAIRRVRAIGLFTGRTPAFYIFIYIYIYFFYNALFFYYDYHEKEHTLHRNLPAYWVFLVIAKRGNKKTEPARCYSLE